MGEFIDKAKGAANEAIGKGKVAAGKTTDNPELIAKGTAQKTKGKVQKVVGSAKGAMGNKV